MTRQRGFAILFILLAAIAGWGHAAGNWQRVFGHHDGAAAKQRALDRLFGGAQAFDAPGEETAGIAAGPDDSVSWQQLSDAEILEGRTARLKMRYGSGIKALDGQDITITGYMFPLEGAENQSRFLLSAYPPSCPYCLPAGPAELIEVTDSGGIPFTYDPVTLHGTFHLIRKPEDLMDGMFYRMSDARPGRS